MVDDYTPEDAWYFVALVASGVGFWLVCRLIAAAILKRSKPPITVCGYQRHRTNYDTNYHRF